MRKIIIGLFNPVSQDLTAYVNRLQGIGEIRFIAPGQKNLGPIDLLIYPDGMGVIPTTPGLSHGDRVFTPSRPINPFFYLFWNETPFQTLTEERGIPIIGFGDAAAMMYSELGGNIIVNADGTISMLEDPKLNFEQIIDPHTHLMVGFNNNKVYGATTPTALTTVLKEAISDVLMNDLIDDLDDDDNDGDPPVDEPKPLRPSPPARGYKN